MAFNGSGIFNRLYSWVADAAASINISSTKMDAEMDGMATGLSNCVTKDGQTTPTANLPMGGFKHTGVGDSSALTSYPSTKQVQNGTFNYSATDTGSANAYVCGLSPSTTVYTAGLDVFLLIANTNTGACTLNVNSLGVKNIKTHAGSDPTAGALVAGQVAHLKYNGTSFELLTEANVIHNTGTETVSATLNMSGKAINFAEGAAVASAATCDIWTPADGNTVHITGSTGPITSFGTAPQAGAIRWLIFDSTPTITHDGSAINILNGGQSVTVEANDMFRVYADTTTQFDIIHFRAAGTGANIQTYTSGSGTWNKPSGFSANAQVRIQLWAGGASGGSSNNATFSGGGGGGGAYTERIVSLSSLGSTESYAVGAGGTAVSGNSAGVAGGNSTFGSIATAYGGGRGGNGGTAYGSGGGGGGTTSAGATGVSGAPSTGGLGGGNTVHPYIGGNGGDGDIAAPTAGGHGGDGGGGGGGGNGGTNQNTTGIGGNSYRGGAGGGGGAGGTSGAAGGTSAFGGNGGAGATGIATATSGTAPGGGGGGAENGTSGAGADGKIIITVYP